MSMEINRQLLEEVNTIENAIAQRFQRNPDLRNAACVEVFDEALASGAKRSQKETLEQAHELKYFADQAERNCARLKINLESESMQKAISDMADPGMKFAPLLSAVKEINAKFQGAPPSDAESLASQFAMFLSAPPEEIELSRKKRKVKRKYHLASATKFIGAKVASCFNESEMLGKYVDLTLFYEMYKSLSGSNISYTHYLRSFGELNVSSKTFEYTRYLESLSLYLRNFAENAFPLREFKFKEQGSSSETPMDDGQANENGEVFCKACNKFFSKQTVYDGHLNGKKHKKLQALAVARVPSQPSHRPSHQNMENEIRQLLKMLAPVIILTANDHERRSRMFEREKQIELDAIEGNQSDFTSIDSDYGDQSGEDNNLSDDDLKNSYERDLPIGSDGIPIPLWLYKLQGLHKTYTCEICGNQEYKGRQQFDKHFGQTRHLHGLKCLGVADNAVPLFASVCSIEEAQKLWQNIRSNLRAQEEESKGAIEVEDENGNVMSHTDYMELKKQGLI